MYFKNMKQSEILPEKTATTPKRSWPLWKKLVIVGVILVVVIGLAVGLGVGLTRNHGGNDNDDSSGTGDGDGSSNGKDDGGADGPDRPSVWLPGVNATWQIVLKRPVKLDPAVDPNVAIWDLDLFDNDVETFKTLQKAGKKIICYFSAGSYEDWRDDKDLFQKSDLGNTLDGWPDERWLKLDSDNVRSIMKKRIKLAWSKGCDAIDPDNVDGYVSGLLKFLRKST